MPIKIEAHPSATGIFTLTNPNSATARGITLPDADTTLVGTDVTQTLTNKTIQNSIIQGGGLTFRTAVAATGSPIEFASIPSWVKRISFMLQGISTNGNELYMIQLGSGTYTTTGYLSSASSSGGNASETTGFILSNGVAAGDVLNGMVQLVNIYGNVWVESGVCHTVSGSTRSSAGAVTLSGQLDRVRLTTTTGTNVYDAGFVNIMYEG